MPGELLAKLGGVTPLLCCRRSCVGRHPEPFLGGREHLLEARVIANRIDIRIDFDVAHVRAAVEPLEERLKGFEASSTAPISWMSMQPRL